MRITSTSAKPQVVLLQAAALTVGLLFAWYARHVLLLAFAGALFAVFLARLATPLGRYARLPRGVAFVLVLLVLASLVALVVVSRGSEIAAESRRLVDQLPGAIENVRAWLAERVGGDLLERLPGESELVPRALGALPRVTGWITGLFGALASAAIVVFFAIAFAATPSVYVEGLLGVVPRERRGRARELIDAVGDTLWWWLLGRLASMTFVGGATFVGLWLLGVPLPFILALLAALASFVPNVGPIVAAIPALLLAWGQSPALALWVAGIYVAVQTVESYLLMPWIDRKTVHLPPALTVLAQLCFALVGGLVGVALATPITAASITVAKRLWR
jgi:predicted PurR-regulated permease PerM